MTAFWIAVPLVLLAFALVRLRSIIVRYRREIGAAQERLTQLNSQVIETDAAPTEYRSVGDGYPVLVVHGALGGFDQGLWLAQGNGLNLPGVQIISVSRFGHLRSPVPAYANLDSQADAFVSLLDALGIPRAAVFAASGGSTSAIRFVARYPDRVSALILLCPDAPPGISLPPQFIFETLLRSDFLYWAMVTFFPKSVQNAAGMVPKGYVLSPQQEALIKTILKGNLPISSRIDGFIFESYTTADEFLESVSAGSPYPLSRIQTPVLILDALDDPIANLENVRGLAERMPNARLVTMPDGGHFFFGHREEVKDEIARFLRSNLVELQNETLKGTGEQSNV
jgi:pimeloyl-ACP methyl ester carboxylesterase